MTLFYHVLPTLVFYINDKLLVLPQPTIHKPYQFWFQSVLVSMAVFSGTIFFIIYKYTLYIIDE